MRKQADGNGHPALKKRPSAAERNQAQGTMKQGTMSQFSRSVSLLLMYTIALQMSAKIDEPEKIGNFLLPSSQQAGPLFGFGQNIVDKGDKQVFLNYNLFQGRQRSLSILFPGFLYGIRDDLSLFIFFPIITKSRDGCSRSHGISDILMQLEYAYVDKKTKSTATQATVIGALFLPTGSAKKIPSTGFGSPSILLGATFSYTTRLWLAWVQGGAILTSKHHGTKFGNKFLYQTGFEWCFYAQKGWLLAWMIEGLGLYEHKDRMQEKLDKNSGGNTFWIGPSFWASSKKWIIQAGVAAPVVQHLSGIQNKYSYWIDINIGYKF